LPVLNFIKINDVDQSTRKCLKAIDRATAFGIALSIIINWDDNGILWTKYHNVHPHIYAYKKHVCI